MLHEGGCDNSSWGWVSVSNGITNGRSFCERIGKGKITITGMDDHDNIFKRIVKVEGGQVWDNKIIKEGKPVYHVVYGEFEREGRNIVHFRKGTGTGKHGLARRYEELFGHKGVCHSFYKNGRLVRQRFIYDNKRIAYDYNAYRPQCTIKDYEGNVLYEVSGALDGRLCNAMRESHTVFEKGMKRWFSESKPFEVKNSKGKIIYKGEHKNHQRVGTWVEDGVTTNFVNGVGIPTRINGKAPEKLTILEVLKIDNAQVRMALMDRFEPEAVAKCGKVIHKEGDMRLYSIKNLEVKILRVRCTTTKAYYYLKVPKDSKKCEEARQWTFGVGDYLSEPIKFEVET